jgi:hypothetical protein
VEDIDGASRRTGASSEGGLVGEQRHDTVMPNPSACDV